MSEIQFDTDQIQYKPRTVVGQQHSSVGGITGWLLQKGIIKDESQAGGVLMAIVIINFILTALVIYFFVF